MTRTSDLQGPSNSGPAGLSPRPEEFAIRRRKARSGDQIKMGLLASAAGFSILVTLGIVFSLLMPAISFFREIPVSEFLTGTRWAPRFSEPDFGVLPLITGTLWTTVIALALAVPVGLAAAVYLAEYAKPSVRKVLKPVLEVLAGIPSVVYGYFAVTFVAPQLLKPIFGEGIGTFSVLSAGLVLGIMIVPTIASLSEDALSAVPRAMRDGSLALGANRMRTVTWVLFPAAISGIAASIVLAISRAVGETMIVALAAGTQARLVAGPLETGQTMTGFIAQTATGESIPGTLTYNTLFAVGLMLFLITLLINVVSIRLVNRYRETY